MRWLTAATVCAAGLLAGCGEDQIRAGATEKTVANLVAEHTHFRPTDVRCPSGIPAKVGERFQCHFTGPDAPYTARLRIVSIDGEKVVYNIVTRPTRSGQAGGG